MAIKVKHQQPTPSLRERVTLAVERLGIEHNLQDAETRLDTARGWQVRGDTDKATAEQATFDASAVYGPYVQTDELAEARKKELEAAAQAKEAQAIANGRLHDVQAAQSALDAAPDIDTVGIIAELRAKRIGFAREMDELRGKLIDRAVRYREVGELMIPLSNGLVPGVPTIRHLRGEPFLVEYLVGVAWHVNPRRAPAVSRHFRDLNLGEFEEQLWANVLATSAAKED